MIATLLWLLVFQTDSFQPNIGIKPQADWETLARPWMTEAEAAIYDDLDSDQDRRRFQGTFVARRLEAPETWPSAGLFLPEFFPKQEYGDIRDYVAHAMGRPQRTEPHPLNPSLPKSWIYTGKTIHFQPDRDGKVKLDPQSNGEWDSIKDRYIKRPSLRYQFKLQSFGRTRLPAEITWLPSRLNRYWLFPQANGAKLVMEVPITDRFREYLDDYKADPQQHIEMLVFLKQNADDPWNDVDTDLIRHASISSDLKKDDVLVFETNLPEGYHAAEFRLYSGFLPFGMKASEDLLVLPTNWPRLSDPIVTQDWFEASPLVPNEAPLFLVNGVHYRPSKSLNPSKPTRILVQGAFDEQKLLVFDEQKNVRTFQPAFSVSGWTAYDLPTGLEIAGYLALGRQKDASQWALAGKTEGFVTVDDRIGFEQQGNANYLLLDQLAFKLPQQDQPTMLFFNQKPALATNTASLDWITLNWGQRLDLRLAYQQDKGLAYNDFFMRRTRVFQQLQVKPKYIVAGTRNLSNLPKAVDFNIVLEGQPVSSAERTPYRNLDKMWGIVVNDALLKSPAWSRIRSTLLAWLKKHLREGDLAYVVQISDRPKLLLAPTPYKSKVHAALEALQPSYQAENYFTLAYLINALTHLQDHGTRPHQVMLLTNQLTDELVQMESLLPRLRELGLQLYNVEFPFAYTPESQPDLATDTPDYVAKTLPPRDPSADRVITRDHPQDNSNVRAGWSLRFGTRKAEKQAKEEQLRRDAFVSAFNTQLATRSAGIAQRAGFGETTQSMHRFLDQLAQWQETLTHVKLPVPYLDEEMVSFVVPEGHDVAWTLVEWQPKSQND
jgi:hypothetical protein